MGQRRRFFGEEIGRRETIELNYFTSEHSRWKEKTGKLSVKN